MLYDPLSHELVFEAVSGEGQGRIIGERLPASTGIAGWVLTSGEAMIVEDVSRDPRFARAVAERTGYVPTMLMSAPLIHGEETMGVLNILDRKRSQFAAAGEMQLLGMFANHAAIALSVVQRRSARSRCSSSARQREDRGASIAASARHARRTESEMRPYSFWKR